MPPRSRMRSPVLSSDRARRVLFFVPRLITGGMEKQMALLAAGLDRGVFEPLVWCPGDWGPIGDLLLERGVEVLRKPMDLSTPNAIDRLIAWLSSLTVSVFYSFAGPNGFDTVLAKTAGVPACVTYRGDVRHWDQSGAISLLEQVRNAETDAVVANCLAVAEACTAIEALSAEHVHVIPNGVPRVLDAPCNTGADLLIGNVANYRPLKGQQLLLEALQEVAKRIPAAHLVIAGRTVPALLDRAEELGLKQRVTFMGEIANADELYPGMALYVHPSYSEGLSNAILEAMANGLAVVATNVGGTAEAVVDGVTGLLVSPGDSAALAEAMIELLRNEPRRMSMGAAALEKVTTEYSVELLVTRHMKLFQNLLEIHERQAER